MSLTIFLTKSAGLRFMCAGLSTLLLAGCGDNAGTVAGANNTQVAAGEQESAAATAQAELSVTNTYLRQPAPGQTMLAAFVTFKNNSSQAYTLNHVASPRASAVEVHRTLYNDGVMSMRHVHHLVVPPKSELVFKPGGYHLMLSGVEGELKPGEKVPLRFSFEGGVSLSADAEVRPIH